MKKFLWLIPGVAMAACLAAVISCAQRECWSMAWFWAVMFFEMILATTIAGDSL